mgnify:CR=1 FL=1
MNKKEAEQKEIKIYWWNFRNKTLDFKGSYKDFLLKRGIKVRKIHHKESKGYRFKISFGSTIICFNTFGGDYLANLDTVIKLFLVYLGDKTKFEAYNRTYLLNWR